MSFYKVNYYHRQSLINKLSKYLIKRGSLLLKSNQKSFDILYFTFELYNEHFLLYSFFL